jgi:hypothetical protein
MKRYALKTKQGETINTTPAENETIAAEQFAKLKNISVNDLLKIYNVDIFIR